MNGHVVPNLPSNSVFGSLAEASQFFERGSLGYSVTSNQNHFDGLELHSFTWNLQPLDVTQVTSSFFENRKLFPAGSVEFDSALVNTCGSSTNGKAGNPFLLVIHASIDLPIGETSRRLIRNLSLSDESEALVSSEDFETSVPVFLSRGLSGICQFPNEFRFVAAICHTGRPTSVKGR